MEMRHDGITRERERGFACLIILEMKRRGRREDKDSWWVGSSGFSISLSLWQEERKKNKEMTSEEEEEEEAYSLSSRWILDLSRLEGQDF